MLLVAVWPQIKTYTCSTFYTLLFKLIGLFVACVSKLSLPFEKREGNESFAWIGREHLLLSRELLFKNLRFELVLIAWKLFLLLKYFHYRLRLPSRFGFIYSIIIIIYNKCFIYWIGFLCFIKSKAKNYISY